MRRALAVGLAICGLLIAGFTMIRIAMALQAPEYRSAATFWPFPGLYLVEVVALAFVVVLAVLTQRPRAFPLAWAAIGALSTLSVLGAMTIGPFIGIALLVLVPAMVLGDAEIATRPWGRLCAFGSGLVLQAGAMVAMIQFVIP